MITSTKSTPEVNFDPDNGLLIIRGQSYPENAYKFYEPLLNWLDEYLDKVHADTVVSIELQLPYINTSSTKCFMLLLEKLDAAFLGGSKVQVQWSYNEDNESELECAEEFKEDLSIPFYITPKEEQQ
ncbi:MAG: hypothetical protein K0R67_1834 [Paenibacillus sp.]|nr:hypothetical protein [Paenibacillus sp.]